MIVPPSCDTRRQSGLTLVEILVALSIGLFIIGAIIAMFISSRQVYRSQDALTRIQENGRFAVEVIARDIRAAGLLGCQSYLLPEVPRLNGVLVPGRIRNTLNPDPPAAPAGSFDFSAMVQGYDAVAVAEDADPTRRRIPPVDPAGEADAAAASWNPALPAAILAAGTRVERDVLVLRGVESLGVRVTAHPGGTPPGSAAVQVESGSGIEKGQVLLVSDCESGAIFQATNVQAASAHHDNIVHNTGNVASPGNWTQALGRNFVGASVYRVNAYTYFVATGANGLPALFRRQLRADPGPPVAALEVAEELVDGVRDFQVFFGIDATGDRVADQYVPASAGWTPNQAVAVRVTLLLMSAEDNVTGEPRRFVYDGGEVYDLSEDEYEIDGRADRHMYQVFTTTVGLRNRLP